MTSSPGARPRGCPAFGGRAATLSVLRVSVADMTAAEKLLRQLTDLIDACAWDSLGDLLHPDFVCRYVHTGETLDAAGWIRLNADYPGFGRLELLDVVAAGNRAVGRAHITGGSESPEQEFEVASFITEREGRIAELTEVWTDVGQAAPVGTRAATEAVG